MRALHIVPDGERRGAEIFAADLVRALRRAGVAQRVVLIHGPLHVKFDAPIDVLASRSPRPRDLRSNLHVVRSLRRIIAAWRPDVAQAHGGESLKFAVPACWSLGTPIVYRRIGAISPWLDSPLHRTLHVRLVRRAAAVVALAEELRTEVVHGFRMDASRVVVVPNAIDHQRLEPLHCRARTRRALGIRADDFVVLSVGALTWEKDPLGHLAISAGVLEARPNVVHVFVGDGSLRGALESDAARRGLGGRVLVLGDRSDVGDLLCAGDVVLVASRTEGMPGCVIEAGMAGVATAAYAFSGVREVVEDGVTGVLAPPGDPAALAARLLAVVDDAPARQAMGAAARERCRAFDIQPVAAQFLDLYGALAPLADRIPRPLAVGAPRGEDEEA